MEDERRLYYVGMTRAKDRLFLCSNGSHPFVGEVCKSASDCVSVHEASIGLSPEEERETRAELWEMKPDDVILSYPASKNGHQVQQQPSNALQTDSGSFDFKPWGERFLITSGDVPVCALSAKGASEYKKFQDRGLRVEKIVHLASLYRTRPSRIRQAIGWTWSDARPGTCRCSRWFGRKSWIRKRR
jgi:ATP-dependent DNA helicase RecQ